MAENVSPPSLPLPAMFPSHMVTLSAARGGGVVVVVGRGWLVLCAFTNGETEVQYGHGRGSGFTLRCSKQAPASTVLL